MLDRIEELPSLQLIEVHRVNPTRFAILSNARSKCARPRKTSPIHIEQRETSPLPEITTEQRDDHKRPQAREPGQ